MNEHETIADLIVWLRRPREGENAYLALWRDEIADRLEAAARRELSKNASKNGADFGQLGNAAKLREALENCADLISNVMTGKLAIGPIETIEEIDGIISKALAAPPRNCDKLSVKEQNVRYNKFCHAHRSSENCCGGCPLNGESCCELAWTQLPYEEGGAK